MLLYDSSLYYTISHYMLTCAFRSGVVRRRASRVLRGAASFAIEPRRLRAELWPAGIPEVQGSVDMITYIKLYILNIT